jgi:phosphoglycerate dehydrogenase-like enzyme
MPCEAVATTAREDFIPVHAISQLPELIGGFDVVIVTVPHTSSTDKLFDAALFGKMKPGSIFVNLARGKVVDEQALLAALLDGPLYFAVLDVFCEEPLPADSPFFDLPNVVMTPHTSGNFPDYTVRAHELFLENLRRFINHEELKYVVDKSRGY